MPFAPWQVSNIKNPEPKPPGPTNKNRERSPVPAQAPSLPAAPKSQTRPFTVPNYDPNTNTKDLDQYYNYLSGLQDHLKAYKSEGFGPLPETYGDYDTNQDLGFGPSTGGRDTQREAGIPRDQGDELTEHRPII
jgi:hypothetical protein